jgi:uncharacterized membrane protein YfcA
MTLLLAAAVGALLGSALGLLGGGGGILAVPMLVSLLGMDVDNAATASLVIVLFGAAGGLVSHHRAGRVLWSQGLLFGAVSIAGATVGTVLAAHVPDWVKLGAFAGLMVAAGVAMLRNARRQPVSRQSPQPSLVGAGVAARDPGAALVDIPAADLPRSLAWDVGSGAAQAAVSPGRARRPGIPLLILLATATGLVTGFLGVGGGFLVVPALVLSLRMPLAKATATGLVVIALASASSLVIRVAHTGGLGQPSLMAVLVLAAVSSSLVAARFSGLLSPRTLGLGFALLVLGMSALVTAQALQALG